MVVVISVISKTESHNSCDLWWFDSVLLNNLQSIYFSRPLCISRFMKIIISDYYWVWSHWSACSARRIATHTQTHTVLYPGCRWASTICPHQLSLWRMCKTLGAIPRVTPSHAAASKQPQRTLTDQNAWSLPRGNTQGRQLQSVWLLPSIPSAGVCVGHGSCLSLLGYCFIWTGVSTQHIPRSRRGWLLTVCLLLTSAISAYIPSYSSFYYLNSLIHPQKCTLYS